MATLGFNPTYKSWLLDNSTRYRYFLSTTRRRKKHDRSCIEFKTPSNTLGALAGRIKSSPWCRWPCVAGHKKTFSVLAWPATFMMRSSHSTGVLMDTLAQRPPADEVRDLPHLPVPHIEFPWPSACFPEVDIIEHDTIDWADSHELLVSDGLRARVAKARYGWLAARCYPRAKHPLMQAISNFMTWLFLVDDMFVDQSEIASESPVPRLTAMLDVLDCDRISDEPVYGEVAFMDVCRRFRELLPAEHFARFANGMRLWATAAGWQSLNPSGSHPIGMRAYQAIRRHFSGANPCLDLIDSANAGPLPAAEYYLPAVQQLRLHINNMVCWSNDIQSLAVEMAQSGQCWNMVAIYAAQGHSLQEGIEHTARKVRSEITEFRKLEDTLGIPRSPELRGYVIGMKDWVRGYLDWVEHDTKRYAIGA